MLYAASATPPIFGPNDKNPDGSPALSFSAPGTFSFPNWVNSANQQTNVSKEIRLLSSVYGEVDFLENFTFRSSASIDYKSGPNRTFYTDTVTDREKINQMSLFKERLTNAELATLTTNLI